MGTAGAAGKIKRGLEEKNKAVNTAMTQVATTVCLLLSKTKN